MNPSCCYQFYTTKLKFNTTTKRAVKPKGQGDMRQQNYRTTDNELTHTVRSKSCK